MAVIEERKGRDGKTVYRVRVRVKGYPEHSATFSRKTDARLWAQETEAALKLGRHLPQKEAKKRTFSDLVKLYVERELPKRRSDRVTYATYLEAWRARLGPLCLVDVTPQKIAEGRDALSQEVGLRGKVRTPQTVKHYLHALSACMGYAVRELGWLEENPVLRVKMPSTARNGRLRFLSEEERERLLSACQASKSPYLYPLVVLALATGARWSELLSLTWDNVDLRGRVVRFMDTKNGDHRAVPLSTKALEVLQALRPSGVVPIKGWVFPGSSGRHADPREAWEFALQRAQVEDFRFHDLRHTAASYLAMNGASLLEIGHILGHRTAQMTRRYAHLTEQHTREAIDALDVRMFGHGG
jgi:integrase